jgi:phosphoribosylformylglycinamidine (FGAM) synthase-like enzyme
LKRLEEVNIIHNLVTGESPKIDLHREKDLHSVLLKLIEKKWIKSSHDVSEGGLISCLAECCILEKENLIGADVNIPVKSREDFSFFSESQSRIVVSIGAENRDEFEKYFPAGKIYFTYLGKTGGSRLFVNGIYEFGLDRLADLYYNTILKIMKVPVEEYQ